MAVNLLDFLQDQFTPHTVDELSDKLNETPEATRRAVEGVLPAVLGGLVSRTHESGGASAVLDVLKDGNYTNTPLDVSQVADSRDEMQAASASGSSLLDKIFGDNTDKVAGAIATHSGVKQPSALVLMGLVGSVLMNMLGRQFGEKGLSSDNLRTLLAGQTNLIRSAFPAGLVGLETLLGLDKLHTPTGGPDAAQGVTNATNTPVDPDIPKSPEIDRRRENGWQRWVLAALAALIVVLLVQKCREPQTSTEGYTNAEEKKPAGEYETAASGANPAQALNDNSNGPRVNVSLPGNRSISTPENSFSYNLARFVEGKPKDLSRVFALQDLKFESNTDKIIPDSRQELKDLKTILEAYPSMHVKVTGYTDSRGTDETNQKLSEARATAVKQALIESGIAADRIDTNAKGEKQPEATNATAEGRQENRRTELQVTKL